MPVKKVKDRDDAEAKESLTRLYMKGHEGTGESEALHQVEKFLGLQKERQALIRENWERDAYKTYDPTPDLTPAMRKQLSLEVRYEIPKKPRVYLGEEKPKTLEEQLAEALERIAYLEEQLRKKDEIIRELEK